MNVFIGIELFCLVIFLICFAFVLPSFFSFCKGTKASFVLPSAEAKTKFAVIIPARDESKVIEGNLRSLQSSDYPSELTDIWIVVENPTDPTVEIAAKYPNAHVFVRKDLSAIGKGHALDECLQHIYQEKLHYDAFIILDADNVVGKNFLSRMSDAYQAGYDVACGNRENKDWNVSAVSAASSLTFTCINLFQNRPKSALGKTVMLSGTGFFIRAELLQKMGGWKFYSLTEDYELSTYARCAGWKTCFVEDALYYDEQPIKLSQSIKQRSRWIKGYFWVQWNYRKMKRQAKEAHTLQNEPQSKIAKTGGLPTIFLCIDVIFYLVCLLGFSIAAIFSKALLLQKFLIRLLCLLLGVYLLICVFTVFLFHAGRQTIVIGSAMRIKAVLYHPIFLATYVIAAVRALFTPHQWERTDHTLNRDINTIGSP